MKKGSLVKNVGHTQRRSLLKGDSVVCVTKGFDNFTYGRKYVLYDDYVTIGLLPILNDIGNKQLPAYFYSTRDGEYRFYFVMLDEWRDMILNELVYEV